MNELHLFAGAGGGILGSELLGIRTICAVELEPYPASVLLARQNDGLLPPFPVWDDVCTFDGRPWRGIVDVVSGGFPCQDISVSGKRKGLEGARSGLWSEMARIICEVRPGFVFLENSPNLTRLGLDRVLGNLAEMGYDAEWCVLACARYLFLWRGRIRFCRPDGQTYGNQPNAPSCLVAWDNAEAPLLYTLQNSGYGKVAVL